MSEPTHTVLIVEDAVELAEIVQVTLEQLNLRVFHETHGQRALEVYDAEHPALVLLDIALPDMTGWVVTTNTSACTLSCTIPPGGFLVLDSASLAGGACGRGTFRLVPDA